jgi:WD40 repeat protein
MQYVAGQSLQELIDESGPPPLRQIVRIGAQAAAGLAAAHAQNLIHRDVKPGNILLESGGDRVKITDFGLARAAEDVRLTQSGFVAGTPLFMAPEQANGQGIDARTDLFSLGSVLYALCTGKAPFEGSTPFLVLRRITEEAPPPIRDVNPDVPEWLVDVIDTLMAKKPDDRFQSAAEVAALLEDRLTQLPAEPRTSVLASSGSRTLSRRARPRGRLLLPALAGIAVLFAGLYGAEVAGLTHAKEFLAGPPSAVAAEPTPPRLNLDGHSGPVWALAYSPPEGKTLAMALDDGSVKLWELPAGNLRATLRLHEGPIWAVAFSPDGNTLATAGDDNLAKVYDLIDRHEIMALNHPAPVRSMAFSKDGQVLATGCQDGSVRLWDLATGIESTMATKHARAVMAVAFAPDGKTLATGGGDKTVQLWDVERSAERTTLERLTGGVWAVAFSPDGKTLASGGWDQGVRLWDVSTGNRQGLFAGHSQDVRALAFSPDGAAVVSGGDDRTVKVWQAATGQEIASFPGHERTICGVAFAPDAKSVASGGRDGTIKVWDVKVWDLPN